MWKGLRSEVTTLLPPWIILTISLLNPPHVTSKPAENKLVEKPEAPLPAGCPRGNIYLDDCNSCYCQEGKGYSCTTFQCVPPPPEDKTNPIVLTSPATTSCPKGDTYMVKCNTCTCMGESTYICSSHQCREISIEDDLLSPRSKKKNKCAKGKRYYDSSSCSWCHCKGSAGGYKCEGNALCLSLGK